MTTRRDPLRVLGKRARFVENGGHVVEGRVLAWTDQPVYDVQCDDGSRRMVLAQFLRSVEDDGQQGLLEECDRADALAGDRGGFVETKRIRELLRGGTR